MDINELIDWVANKLWEINCTQCFIPDSITGCSKTKDVAREILGHPSLYLEVDGDISDWGKYTWVRFNYCGMNPEGKPKYLIPLTEAIGEMEADEDIKLGRLKTFNSAEELIDELHKGE